MMCPICGARTMSLAQQDNPDKFQCTIVRTCERGHLFETREVQINMLADEREMSSALRHIRRRVERWRRDARIAQDTRPATLVAAEHNITEARVRQIRAGFIDPAHRALNSERKDDNESHAHQPHP